jgi:hypothetical protein
MVFLHPDVKVYPGAESYKPALERFSEFLKQDDLGGLPRPKGDIGPIRKMKTIKKGDPIVKKHTLRVHQWEPGKADDLKIELDDILLRDVFGLEGDQRQKYEKVLREKLWPLRDPH